QHVPKGPAQQVAVAGEGDVTVDPGANMFSDRVLAQGGQRVEQERPELDGLEAWGPGSRKQHQIMNQVRERVHSGDDAAHDGKVGIVRWPPRHDDLQRRFIPASGFLTSWATTAAI